MKKPISILFVSACFSVFLACEDSSRVRQNSLDFAGGGLPNSDQISTAGMTTSGGDEAQEWAGEEMTDRLAGELADEIAGEIADEIAGEIAGEMVGGDQSSGIAGEMNISPPADPPEDCVSDLDFFETHVWRPVIKPLCADCHNPQGAAQSTDMVYVPEEQLNALETNYEIFADIASLDRDGTPLVLLKPLNELPHGGGELFTRDSETFATLRAMIDRARASEPTICDDVAEEGHDEFFVGVKLLDAQETLRRASLSLAGRFPTLEEAELVSTQGWGGVEVALNQILHSERFYRRLKELWNDILLTNKYLGQNAAIDLLNADRFPNARWHLNGGQPRDAAYWAAIEYANNSLATEALEHIVFVVREGRPFHEVITADYIAMNPFTARIHGVEDIEWDDPLDPKEFREGRAPGIPHAGILSSPMFLNRFPTTDTNRNRHRARIFFKLFLDLDVFKIAERPIDPTSTAHNPTMNDPQCSICHTVIDPVAGAFQHWDEQGSFRFRDTWYDDMRAPGFMNEDLPYEERQMSLRWLALQASADPRFDRSIVRLMYQALIGDELLSAPAEGDFLAERELAFDTQQRFIDSVAAGFRANQHDLRWLIKALIRSPYYRAQGFEDDLVEVDEALQAQWAHLGLDKPLTPEQLNRKLHAATGVRWRPNARSQDYLLDAGQYRLLYGGIDSDGVVERIRTPNSIFANIQRRMSNEVACHVSAYDFTRDPEARFLFPWIEPSYEPLDPNGFPIPQVEERIRANLKHLAWTMWGERYEVDAPEIEALYDLWFDVWTMGLEELDAGNLPGNLTWGCRAWWNLENGAELPVEERIGNDPRFTIRAWSAVLSVFLSDPAFLYE